MKEYKQQKSKVDTLIEELDKTFEIPGVKGNKTGSFIHISSKLKTMQTDNMKKGKKTKPKDYPFNDYSWQNTLKVREALSKQPKYSREQMMQHMEQARKKLEDYLSQKSSK